MRPSGSPVTRPGSSVLGSVPFTKLKSARPGSEARKVSASSAAAAASARPSPARPRHSRRRPPWRKQRTAWPAPTRRRAAPRAAARHHVRAARVEAAAGRRLERARHVAREHDALAAPARVGHRDRREQRVRVGMARAAEELPRSAPLDDPAEVHHRHAVGEVPTTARSCEMKRYVSAELAPAVAQQVQDLRLDRDVERGDRLVADDELRAERERARDADALALAARELVRVALPPRRRAGRPARAAPPRASSSSAPARDAVHVRAARPRCRPPSCAGSASEYGSWKMICMRAAERAQRGARRARAGRAPSKRTLRRRSARSSRRTQPRRASSCRSPTRRRAPSVSPGATSKRTPSTACTAPTGRREAGRRAPGSASRSVAAPRRAARAPRPLTRAPRQRGRAARPRARHGPSSAQRARALADDRRRLARAARQHLARAARVEAQPGGRWSAAGTVPGIGREPPRATPRRGSERSRPRACRDGAGASKSSRTGALLDDAAGVHHRHALARSRATTPRSCVISSTAMPSSRWSVREQLEDLRLDRHVERGRRLVGDQQRGLAGERHRDHHALAHAARELVRILVGAPLGRRDADAREQLDGARARAARGRIPRCSASASAICSPTRKHRVQATSSAPGRSSRSSLPRTRADARRRRARAGRAARSRISPRGDAPGRRRRGAGSRARSPSCRSPTRRRARASRRPRARARRRAPPAPARRRSRRRRAGPRTSRSGSRAGRLRTALIAASGASGSARRAAPRRPG